MGEEKHAYGNIDNHSSITHYSIGQDYILIWYEGFSKPKKYSFASASESNVIKMIELARAGKGLNRFVVKKVKGKYER
jgi:hypothetical protein